MKRLLLATLAALAVAAPASALASSCSVSNACEGGAQFASNNYGVFSDIDAGILGTSNGATLTAVDEVYVEKGAYTIEAGIAYGTPYAFGANNDFFIKTVGPSTTNLYWYPSANWQPSTYYHASIVANGGNSWTATIGPFVKTIANNGITDHATLLGTGFIQEDPCWGATVNETDLGYYNDIGGGSYLTAGFPSTSLFRNGTGADSTWQVVSTWDHAYAGSC